MKKLFRQLVRPIRILKQRICRIYDWLPVLWNDEDWDWAFLLEIWAYKLKRQRECIVRNNFIESAGNIHEKIIVCEDSLKRLAADDYCSKEWHEYWEKWPSKTPKTSDSGSYSIPMVEQEKLEFLALVKKQEDSRKADEELFWKTFRDNYRDWWD